MGRWLGYVAIFIFWVYLFAYRPAISEILFVIAYGNFMILTGYFLKERE